MALAPEDNRRRDGVKVGRGQRFVLECNLSRGVRSYAWCEWSFSSLNFWPVMIVAAGLSSQHRMFAHIADWIPPPDKLHSPSHGGLLNPTGTKTPSPPGVLTATPASVSAPALSQTPRFTEQDYAICIAWPLDSRIGRPRSADLDLRLHRLLQKSSMEIFLSSIVRPTRSRFCQAR